MNPNISWNLGNDRKILFWKDSWLESYGPLANYLNSEAQIDTINHTVAEMVDDRGN